MPKNLPEKLSDSIPSLSERAALFADPPSLLSMDPSTLRDLAAEVAEQAGPIMKQVRTMVGLVSWALRSKVPAGEFGAWIQSYSELVGVSVRTLHEWRVQATEAVGIIDPYKSKREPKAAGESGRLAESRQSPKVIPAASTEVPAKEVSEGRTPEADPAAGWGEGGSTPPVATGTRLPLADQSSGGARTTAPPVAPTGEAPTSSSPAPLDPSERPPSRRQQASAIVAAFQDAEDGVGRGWTHEEATYLFARFRAERDAWATYNKASIQWADAPPAPAEKPQRRQGTITRPADREPKRQAWADRPRTPVTMPLMPAPKIGKRHADDCSCLSCKAPKAVAK